MLALILTCAFACQGVRPGGAALALHVPDVRGLLHLVRAGGVVPERAVSGPRARTASRTCIGMSPQRSSCWMLADRMASACRGSWPSLVAFAAFTTVSAFAKEDMPVFLLATAVYGGVASPHAGGGARRSQSASPRSMAGVICGSVRAVVRLRRPQLVPLHRQHERQRAIRSQQRVREHPDETSGSTRRSRPRRPCW